MGIVQLLTWFAGALFVAAIMSRLLSDKQTPTLVSGGVSALANIFHGVFSG
jgi:hypothetical protein